MRNELFFKATSVERGTPLKLFKELDLAYGPFTLDVCATAENKKCDRYFSKEVDGLTHSWGGHICWMNPPYGRAINAWMKKARDEVHSGAAVRVVCLLPARTDTKWFHEFVLGQASELYFLKGRVTFEGMEHPAPFPSLVVVFDAGYVSGSRLRK